MVAGVYDFLGLQSDCSAAWAIFCARHIMRGVYRHTAFKHWNGVSFGATALKLSPTEEQTCSVLAGLILEAGGRYGGTQKIRFFGYQRTGGD
jgi:hypothetical protein